jgi:hypothetical protein
MPNSEDETTEVARAEADRERQAWLADEAERLEGVLRAAR